MSANMSDESKHEPRQTMREAHGRSAPEHERQVTWNHDAQSRDAGDRDAGSRDAGNREAGDRADDERGREAARPSEIPKRGWLDILWRVKDRISRDNLSVIAAGVAFYSLLAISPALVALVLLYGLLFDPAAIEQQVSSLSGVVPGDALNIISQQLKSIATSSNSSLGIGLVVSLLVALWSARSAAGTLMTALDISYGEEEKRGFIRFQATAFAITLCGVVFAVIALVLIAVLPAIVGLLPLGDVGKTLTAVLRWPILIAIVVVALAAMFRYAPSRRQPKWRWVSWGAVLALVLWIIGSALFSIYVGQFASYNKTYGSLGSVVVLLMWLYLTAFVILLGAVLNAEIEHQTRHDTTEPGGAPMGGRGAQMADTLGRET